MIYPEDIVNTYKCKTTQYTSKSGSYAKVYIPKSKHSHKVIKINHTFDLTYLYLKEAMERPKWFMPKVYNLQLLWYPGQSYPASYIAILKRYEQIPIEIFDSNITQQAQSELVKLLIKTKIARPSIRVSELDLHDKNIMWCPTTKKPIITDPMTEYNAGSYSRKYTNY